MNPLYSLEHSFWDIEKLRAEANSVEDIAQEFPFTCPRTGIKGIIRAVPLLPQSDITYVNGYYPDELDAFKHSFLETYPMDWGDIAFSYMWIDGLYPWHVDNEVTNRGLLSGKKGTQCAINVLLSGLDAPIEFEGYEEQIYKAAVVNTSHVHRVNPTTKRSMARISFKDKTFEEVVEGIKEWQEKNI